MATLGPSRSSQGQEGRGREGARAHFPRRASPPDSAGSGRDDGSIHLWLYEVIRPPRSPPPVFTRQCLPEISARWTEQGSCLTAGRVSVHTPEHRTEGTPGLSGNSQLSRPRAWPQILGQAPTYWAPAGIRQQAFTAVITIIIVGIFRGCCKVSHTGWPGMCPLKESGAPGRDLPRLLQLPLPRRRNAPHLCFGGHKAPPCVCLCPEFPFLPRTPATVDHGPP